MDNNVLKIMNKSKRNNDRTIHTSKKEEKRKYEL